MLSFATEFPVHHEHEMHAFFSAVRDWILGSPHTSLTPVSFEGFESATEWSVHEENEQVELLRNAAPEDDSAVVRYSKDEDGLEWTTTIAFSRERFDSWIGVRLSCESSHPAVRLPPAKKPRIVGDLLEQLGGAADGALTVSQDAHELRNSDIGLAAELMDGRAGCRLPVVYVSCGFNGNHIVEIHRLARKLAGMAHVVVEPNRSFSLRLKIEVDSDNVYGGTIGVYWPDGGGRRSFFIGHQYDNADDIERGVFEEIRAALTNRRPWARCTWANVQESVSRRTYNALKAAGSNELEKYVEEFDKELKAKDERLGDAENEIARLKAEVRKHESTSQARAGLTLRTGQEQNYYTGELLNIVLDALREAQRGLSEESRRAHVLSAIINTNGADGEAKKNRELLKQVLRDYRSMDARTRKALSDMGFSIEDDGKHYKLMFKGDERYVFTLAKTGSDYRGGLNAASDIGKRLF